MRNSVDASIVNRPRLIAGMDWQLAVGVCIFFAMAVVITRNWAIAGIGVLLMMFLSGAGRRDPLFLQVYNRHRSQALRYSPAPIVKAPNVNRRPIGYGRYDKN